MYFEIQRNKLVIRRENTRMASVCGAIADLFVLTRFFIPVAFTDIAVDIGEQVTILGRA